MPMDILEIYTLQKMATPNMEAKRGWNFSQWIHSSLTLRLKSSHKGNLEIRKISLLFLKCSNIQCRNHDSGFFTTSQIIEKWLSIFFTEISPQNQGSVMADTGQEGGAENTAGRTSALRAAWGFSCAFKAQAESQRPAGPGREAWPHTPVAPWGQTLLQRPATPRGPAVRHLWLTGHNQGSFVRMRAGGRPAAQIVFL